MNIGLLSNTDYQNNPIGGTLTYLKNYLKYSRIDYTLFGVSVQKKCENKILKIGKNEYNFIPLYCADINKINRLKGSFYTLKNLRKIRRYVKSLYIHNPEMGFVISNFTDMPYIYHMHGANYKTNYSKYKYMRNSFFSYIFKTMVLSSTKNARGVIGVTKECKNLVPSNVPFYYVPISVDTEIFHPVDENEKMKIRDMLGVPQESLIWLYVGRLGKAKNIPFIIDLFSQFSMKYKEDTFLIIVGDGEDKETIIKRIMERKISKKVKLVGKVPHEDTAMYYQAADIFIMASHIEGMPNSILEAMASGLLVVAPNVGGIPEVLDENCGYIYKTYSPKEIIPDIINILSSDRKINLQENALEKISNKYSAHKKSKEIDNIIKEVFNL